MLKQSRLSRRGAMALGAIGALAGYFISNSNGNLPLDILLAAICAAGFVIVASIIRARKDNP